MNPLHLDWPRGRLPAARDPPARLPPGPAGTPRSPTGTAPTSDGPTGAIHDLVKWIEWIGLRLHRAPDQSIGPEPFVESVRSVGPLRGTRTSRPGRTVAAGCSGPRSSARRGTTKLKPGTVPSRLVVVRRQERADAPVRGRPSRLLDRRAWSPPGSAAQRVVADGQHVRHLVADRFPEPKATGCVGLDPLRRCRC